MHCRPPAQGPKGGIVAADASRRYKRGFYAPDQLRADLISTVEGESPACNEFLIRWVMKRMCLVGFITENGLGFPSRKRSHRVRPSPNKDPLNSGAGGGSRTHTGRSPADFHAVYGFRRPDAACRAHARFAVWTIPSPSPGRSGD